MKKLLLVTAILSTSLLASVTQCTTCHGSKFEKVALGKSKVVKNMTEKEIFIALSGYKDGTYGGSLKNVMRPQISKYSKDELITLSKEVVTSSK